MNIIDVFMLDRRLTAHNNYSGVENFFFFGGYNTENET